MGANRLELIPEKVVDELDYDLLSDRLADLKDEALLAAFIKLDFHPSRARDRRNDAQKALYARTRAAAGLNVLRTLSFRSDLECMVDNVIYKTIGKTLYVIGIDGWAENFRILRELGLIPKEE